MNTMKQKDCSPSNKKPIQNFANMFKGISQRTKILIGVSSAMAVSALLWTNATSQSQIDAHIQNMIPKLSERLQAQCHCPIEINVGALSAAAARPALHGIREAVRGVSRLCRKDDQKVCAGIHTIRFEEAPSMSQSASQAPVVAGQQQDPSMMPNPHGGSSQISLESGVLVIPIAAVDLAADPHGQRMMAAIGDRRALAHQVARLLRLNSASE